MIREPLLSAIEALKNVIFSPVLAQQIDWGNKIVWHTTLKEAEEVSWRTKKPVMAIIYHEHCSSCHHLIPRLTNDERIVELARDFTVLALLENETTDKMRIDGNYTPRIYFLAPNGEVQEKFQNSDGNPRYKFYYPNEKALRKTMKGVLKEYPRCRDNKPCNLRGKNWSPKTLQDQKRRN